jgi:hypothetical protein
MDVLSHGLWGGISFGRKNKKSFWLSFFIGIAPDLFSFGIFFIIALFSGISLEFKGEPPNSSLIPGYVGHLYNLTHSLIIFVLIFFSFRIFLKRWVTELLAWPLHILLDIFSHSYQFYPTPFLWPISDYKIDAVSWADPRIFLPNVILLAVLYAMWFITKKYKIKNL